jgi:hypothetical protein
LTPDIVINYISEQFSLDISGRYIGQNEPQPFLNADAKDIISYIKRTFAISKYDIANEMNDNEIADDVKIFINNIHSLMGS